MTCCESHTLVLALLVHYLYKFRKAGSLVLLDNHLGQIRVSLVTPSCIVDAIIILASLHTRDVRLSK